jgi:hypothetical protein
MEVCGGSALLNCTMELHYVYNLHAVYYGMMHEAQQRRKHGWCLWRLDSSVM